MSTKEKKVGISIGALQAKYGDKKALELAKKAGADTVDFSTDMSAFDYRDPKSVFAKSDDEIESYFHDLRSYADSIGLGFSQTHGRITGFRNIPEEDEAFVKNARLDTIACKALGAKYCVIHDVTTIFMGKDADPKLMRDLNYDMFSRIIGFAKENGVILATETFGDATGLGCCDFFGNIDEFVAAYERVRDADGNAPYICTCADTGHSNKAMRFGNPTPANVIRRLGSSVRILHLNDNDTLTDQHKIPMTGTIDWKDVFAALSEIGYDGVYNMELNLRHFGNNFLCETAEFAVKVMRNMLEMYC